MHWILILTIYWYHAPTVTQISGFGSLQACEVAAVAVNKKFTHEQILGGQSTAESVCVNSEVAK